MVDWQNRILSYGVKPADQFLAHPKNARLHPQIQREAVKASLDTLGWIAPVIESKSGYLVDGHERLWQALQDNASVPYIVVDLTPEEEDTALLIFDPITGLANYDAQKLDALLREVNTDAPALQQMLSDLATDVGLTPPNFEPVDISEQPRLDQKKPVICPECGHEFIPKD